jgi:DNA processing protein
LRPKQFTLLTGRRDDPDAPVYYAGELTLLNRPAVSIVGTREVSEEGRGRARRLARELARAGILVVSGLARGVDTASHLGAIEGGGHTAAVIGTPLDKAYPAENAPLQEEIYRSHLLLTPFPVGERVYPSNFPKRNRVMAAVTDATVIVEASDTSGTLHQAAECGLLGRWLFIMKSVAENPHLSWPAKFIGKERVEVLSSTMEILDAIRRP